MTRKKQVKGRQHEVEVDSEAKTNKAGSPEDGYVGFGPELRVIALGLLLFISTWVG